MHAKLILVCLKLTAFFRSDAAERMADDGIPGDFLQQPVQLFIRGSCLPDP
jgi:hypothetical protein